MYIKLRIPESPLYLLGERLYRFSGNVRRLQIIGPVEAGTLRAEYQHLSMLAGTLMRQLHDELTANLAQQPINLRRVHLLTARSGRVSHLHHWLLKAGAVLDRRAASVNAPVVSMQPGKDQL